jgi:hypothetical protein
MGFESYETGVDHLKGQGFEVWHTPATPGDPNHIVGTNDLRTPGQKGPAGTGPTKEAAIWSAWETFEENSAAFGR